MNGIFGALKELYLRFLVWLGAAPPEGYEHLLGKEKKPPAPEPLAKVAEPEPPVKTVEPEPEPAPPEVIEPEPEPAPPEVIEPEPEPEPPSEVAEPEPVLKAPPEVPTPEPPAKVAEPEPEPPAKIIEPKPAPPPEVPAPEPPAKVAEPEPAPPEVIEPEPEPEPVQPPREAPPVETAPTRELLFRYEVQRGDTFNAIARKYGITVKDLLAANDIDDAGRIHPGQKLTIPGYTLPSPELEIVSRPAPRPEPPADGQFIYTVAGGDTLNTIAKRYGVTVRQLIEANELDDSSRIKLGQKLVIPGLLGAAEPSPAPPPDVAASPQFPLLGPAQAIRAAYLSYFALGHPETRQKLLALLDSTELNAVVIDVKNDFGWLSFSTNNALAHDIGANRPSAIDFDQFMNTLRQRGIYTIARLVTFKDTVLAKSQPDWTARTQQGALWQDSQENYWVDPFVKPVWQYNIDIAAEAAGLGFNEIQFDYVHFPTPGPDGTPHFSVEANRESRVSAVTGFLSAARGQLAASRVKISARTFGYACWRKDDSLVGHTLEKMAGYLDVLSPMLYPSTFHSGIPGYKNAVAHPYEVVFESTGRAVSRLTGFDCAVRPWLQDFQDYRFDRRTFEREQIQAQIKGCFEAGSQGYLVWNPNSQYTESAYAPVKIPA